MRETLVQAFFGLDELIVEQSSPRRDLPLFE
jgi:hypothetical protein